MAPKRAPARKGSGAAKSVGLALPTDPDAPVAAAVAEQLAGRFPADPVDPRLTLEGAIFGPDGKLDVGSYEELLAHFAGEVPPAQHPDPKHPGLRRGEQLPKGLRIWDDVRAGAETNAGAGWIASRSPGGGDDKRREKWFNIRTCGSWRMAFLLARLQRQQWDSRASWLAAPAGTDVVRTPVKRAKAKSPAPDGEKVAKRMKTAGAATDEQKLGDSTIQTKVNHITAETLAGSSRLKQILEARDKAAALAAAAAQTAA